MCDAQTFIDFTHILHSVIQKRNLFTITLRNWPFQTKVSGWIKRLIDAIGKDPVNGRLIVMVMEEFNGEVRLEVSRCTQNGECGDQETKNTIFPDGFLMVTNGFFGGYKWLLDVSKRQ